METQETNIFRDLLQIDVSKHIEKKGQFSYLSWPYAVSQLRLADPKATWAVSRFNGLPFMETDLGFFVEVAVTVQGITLSQIHPVLDGKNRPIVSPSTFDINTSIQRCLVKAIALHGLGLNVYAGEDLPTDQNEPGQSSSPPKSQQTLQTQQHPEEPDKVTPLPIRDDLHPFGTHPEEKLITSAQLGYVRKLMAETGTDEDQLLDYFGFSALDSIPRAEVNRIITALQGKRRVA